MIEELISKINKKKWLVDQLWQREVEVWICSLRPNRDWSLIRVEGKSATEALQKAFDKLIKDDYMTDAKWAKFKEEQAIQNRPKRVRLKVK